MSDAPRRPNILFLMSDQHRPDFMGNEGHVVRTPVFDWLAEGGVKFSHCYTPAPVCIPGRQAMMAGQLPKTCGCERFSEDLDPGYHTFARHFSEYAYNTIVSGKLHHSGEDPFQGWVQAIGENHTQRLHPSRIKGPYKQEVKRYAKQRSTPDVTGYDSVVASVRRGGTGTNQLEIHDEYNTTGMINWLRMRLAPPVTGKTLDTPLFLKLSLMQPHDPYVTNTDRYYYYYNRVEPFANENPLPEMQGWPGPIDDTMASPDEQRRCIAAYCAMIETINEQYQRVLDTLVELGQDLDDWIIVYTSDHGEMLGQHNCWWKFKFYDASVRVPLLIRAPRYFSGTQVVDANVNLCDLYATFCDMAELPAPEGLDSRSLLPLCRGEDTDWNNESVSHLCQGGEAESVMIKQDQLKYIYQSGSRGETEILFDEARDPQETINYSEDAGYADHLECFRQRRGALGYGPNADPQYRNAGYHQSQPAS